MKTLFAYLSFILLPLMCKKAPDANSYSTEASVADVAYETAPNQPNEKISASIKNDTDTKIVKTANLRFSTTNLNESYTKINKAITKYKAIIQYDNSGKDYNSFYRNISIRVSNTNFDSFIAAISNGVSFFDKKEITAENVTEQYIDLQARIKTKKKLENRYLELLSKASKVSEILEIEKELAVIREEIEAKEGQLQYLQNRVDMSTVFIEMYTENPSGGNATISYGSKMWNAVKSGFNSLSSFFIGILYIWPFILILAIIFFFIRYKLRKKQK